MYKNISVTISLEQAAFILWWRMFNRSWQKHRNIETLTCEVLEKFLKGQHVMRHQKGYWNGIWSDMFTKTTFLRYVKGPGGIVGVTLKPNVVKKWANAFPLPHRCWKILTICEKNQYQSHKNFTKKKQKGEEKAMKMIKLASERIWRSPLIPFREISKVLSTYIQDMLPIKTWMFTTPSRLDRSSDKSSRQAGQMDFIHLLRMKPWPWNQARNL